MENDAFRDRMIIEGDVPLHLMLNVMDREVLADPLLIVQIWACTLEDTALLNIFTGNQIDFTKPKNGFSNGLLLDSHYHASFIRYRWGIKVAGQPPLYTPVLHLSPNTTATPFPSTPLVFSGGVDVGENVTLPDADLCNLHFAVGAFLYWPGLLYALWD